MNLAEVIAAALAYTDRYDLEVQNIAETLITQVESSINLYLLDKGTNFYASLASIAMSSFVDIPGTSALRESALPDDFLAVKSAIFKSSIMQYLPLEALISKPAAPYYAIVGNKLITKLAVTVDDILLNYTATIPPLAGGANWLSTRYSNIYVTGLMTEIYIFVKDVDAASLCDVRFKSLLSNIVDMDMRGSVTGTPKQTRDKDE